MTEKRDLKVWFEAHTVEWLKRRYQLFGSSINLAVVELVEEAEGRDVRDTARICVCGCRRPVFGKARCATAACRQRLSRGRLSQLSVTQLGAAVDRWKVEAARLSVQT